MRLGVDHDPVAVGDERDRPAVDRFGRDVTDAEALRPAREPAVGDERRVVASPGAGHRPRDREHLAHAGAALRPLVADHDDVAGRDLAGEDLLHRDVFAVEDARGAFEAERVDTGDLHHRALRRERAAEDRDAALLVDRIGERVHDGAVGRGRVEVGQVLGHGLARDREAVAVQQPRVEELPHHDLHAADPVEVVHVVVAVRLHVGDVRDARADPVEVVELELDARLVGDREQVQHRVGGAAERHHHGDRVLERLLGHDLARAQVELEQVHHRKPRLVREVVAAPVDRGRRRAPRQRHADGLAHRRHRVGGEHPRAGTLGRAGAPFDLAQLVLGDRAGRAGADRLEHAHDVERAGPCSDRAGSSRRRGTPTAG